jgi:3-methyl-2-oxobutanoate hydroxymethyltransferase
MSTTNGEGARLTVRDFQERKDRSEKLVVVTAYDSLFGKLVDESGVDAVLVGDSVGNLLAGFETTLPVTLDQMVYHARSTRAGVKRALLIVDMPFLTYQVSPRRALENCGRVMAEGGADAVKVEGAGETILAAIPVMGHLGFTPQSVNTLGGTRVQARDVESAKKIVDDAKKLERAGAFSIVLELLPAKVAASVTEAVNIPTIGIGAGAQCSGQVLVLHDLLGLNEGFNPKFLKRYAAMAAEVREAISRFGDEVRSGSYPDDDHSF